MFINYVTMQSFQNKKNRCKLPLSTILLYWNKVDSLQDLEQPTWHYNQPMLWDLSSELPVIGPPDLAPSYCQQKAGTRNKKSCLSCIVSSVSTIAFKTHLHWWKAWTPFTLKRSKIVKMFFKCFGGTLFFYCQHDYHFAALLKQFPCISMGALKWK